MASLLLKYEISSKIKKIGPNNFGSVERFFIEYYNSWK